VERRIELQVRAWLFDRTSQEALDLFVEHLADPGYLRAGDPVDPERSHKIVDLARGHALDVILDRDGLRLPYPS
jgi:hypothetical protein